MMYGEVKWFGAKEEDGKINPYGFVVGMDGYDYFIHLREIRGTDCLEEREKVVFEAEKNKRGLSCKNLQRLSEVKDTSILKQLLVRSLDCNTFEREPLVQQFVRSSYNTNHSYVDAFDAVYSFSKEGYFLKGIPKDPVEIVEKLSKWVYPTKPADEIAKIIYLHGDRDLQKTFWKKFNTPPPEDMEISFDELKDLSSDTLLTLLDEQNILLRLMWDLTEKKRDEGCIALYHFLDSCRRGTFYIPPITAPSHFLPEPMRSEKRQEPTKEATEKTRALVQKALDLGCIRKAFVYVPYILDLLDDIELTFAEGIIAPKEIPPSYQRQVFKKIIFQAHVQKTFQKFDAFFDEDLWSDFTVRFLLTLNISSFANNSRILESEIIQHALSSKKPWHKSIRLYDIFEQCPGRMVDHHGARSSVGYEKERFSRESSSDWLEFCEGREDIQEPELDDNGNPVFNTITDDGLSHSIAEGHIWWCFNLPCHLDVGRRQKLHWERMSMLDYLHLKGINIEWERYKNILGYFNQFHRLEKKLRCSSCNEYMNVISRDGVTVELSKYAYRRLTRFSCKNPDCSKPDENVYLSHCCNRKCTNIVDSRLSVKCKPEGYDQQKSGWWICDYCFACCKTEKLDVRHKILAQIHEQDNCHHEGHWDRGEISCPKCGSLLTIILPPSADAPYPRKTIEYYENELEAASGVIDKKGVRKDGSTWYLLRREPLLELLQTIDITLEQYLTKLMGYGFSVPDIEENDGKLPANKRTVLVSTPTGSIRDGSLQCTECDFKLIFKSIPDEERTHKLFALSWHKPLDGLTGSRKKQQSNVS